MPDHYTPKRGYRFPGPLPREALDYFQAKDLRPGFDYRDVYGQEHASAFTVAKAMQLDVLDDLRDAVESALAEGRTYRQFARDLMPELQRAGWWGRQEQIDPVTGEVREVELGTPRRLKTIYRANLLTARAAGQWERIQRTKATHPYLLYELGPSEEHRPEHVAWAGTLLPVDDPWWRTHMTPNGWGCKCRVRQISRREAERLGGVTARPASPTREWTNKRTGETMRVPVGIDPGWDTNPGFERQRLLLEGLNGKLDAADQALAREAVRTVTDSELLDRQLAPMKPGDPPKGDLPIAFLEREWRDTLGAETQLVRLTQRTAQKQRKKHGGLTAGDYREVLPRVLADAQVVASETGHYQRGGRDLVFFRLDGDRVWKAVVSAEGPRRVRLATFYESTAENMDETLRRANVKVMRDIR